MARERWHRARTVAVFLMYLVYSSCLWWRLYYYGQVTGHKGWTMAIPLALWFTLYVVSIFLTTWSALSSSPSKLLQATWCSVPILLFVLFNVPPYGFTLYHMYEVVDVQTSYRASRNMTCTHIPEPPPSDFILLQSVMPMLLLTYVMYPLPKRAYTVEEYLALAVEFLNAFDIMDIVTDLYFVRGYGKPWIGLYFFCLACSSLTLAFPVKIERDTHTNAGFKMLKELFTLLCTDIMFATIRLKVILTEGSIGSGFNMLAKNIILACLHLFGVLRQTCYECV